MSRKFKITQDTPFKLESTKQKSSLKPIEYAMLEEGATIEISDNLVTEENGHFSIAIKGWIYKNHIKEIKPNINSTKVYPYSLPNDRESNKERIKQECKRLGATRNQTCYILATARHESSYMPIEEIDGRRQAIRLGYKGGANYFGRGFVQLTHNYNYKKYEDILGLPLVQNPHLVMEPNIAVFILVHGMLNGIFTGRRLSQYINSTKTDYYNARRVVNGTDRASLIQKYAREWEKYIMV